MRVAGQVLENVFGSQRAAAWRRRRQFLEEELPQETLEAFWFYLDSLSERMELQPCPGAEAA